jgi:dethiobiotin synthetase
MVKQYFILGTDTNCGKTYVTCQLLSYFRKNKQRSLALKPVASGCVEHEQGFCNDDILQLEQYNQEMQEICRWGFRLPISPHLAAAAEARHVSAQEIIDFCTEKTTADLDCLLIEGAGGLMVPLNDHETWIDVLVASKIPVILVVGMRLGCLNHALLTASVLQIKGIACAGWIANCLDNQMLALPENIQTLCKKMQWPLLCTIPYMGEISAMNDKHFTP